MPSSEGSSSTHTKLYCHFYPLPSNKSKRYTTQVIFNPVIPSQITTSRTPKSPEVKSLIVWQSLYHFLVHQLTTTWWGFSYNRVVGLFCGSSQHVVDIGCFCGGAPSLMFNRILNATLFEEGVCATGVNSPCLKILLIHTKHKTIKQYLGLTSFLHFLEGTLIHWVDKVMYYQQSGRRPCNWMVGYSPWVCNFS